MHSQVCESPPRTTCSERLTYRRASRSLGQEDPLEKGMAAAAAAAAPMPSFFKYPDPRRDRATSLVST